MTFSSASDDGINITLEQSEYVVIMMLCSHGNFSPEPTPNGEMGERSHSQGIFRPTHLYPFWISS